jgi:hypothetical protein
MSKKTKLPQYIAAMLAMFMLSMAPAHGAVQVISPDDAEAATGLTYDEWSAVWWQYVLSKSVTNPNNQLLSATGKNCQADQPASSPIFFLSGNGGGSDPITRDECVVPAGKALFFPLINAFDVHVPGDGLDTPELVRQDLLSLWGPVTALHASVDGQDVAVNLFDFGTCAGGDPDCSAAFSLQLPGTNIFVGSPALSGRHGPPGLPGGTYSPAVAIGYYLMLAPLPAGPHTIKFGGEGSFGGAPSTQDITYNIVVMKH